MATYPVKMLKDKNDSLFVPLTSTTAVVDSNNNNLNTLLSSKQETLVSGTNIKTINNESLLGNGNISISEGQATDVQINGTSIVGSNVANIRTNGTYNASTNKMATMSDLPTKVSQLTNDSGYTTNTGTVTSVAVKMNNTTKGTITTSGTIDLGTVITAHQDISGKVDKVSGKGLSTNDYTTTEKTKLSGIATGAEVNQNTFSNVKVGNTTIQADSKTDTLELVAGNNITLTPNSTNDSVTISATSGVDNEVQLYNFVCSSVIPGDENTNDTFIIDVDTDIRPNTFVYGSTATYINVKLGFNSTLLEQCYGTNGINVRLVKNNTTLKEFGVYRKDGRDISVDYLSSWGVWEYGSNMIFNANFDCSDSAVKILGQNLLYYDDVMEPMTELYDIVIGKQDKLSTQTAYSAKGSATKVPQITTNNLGQVTNITEVTIDMSGKEDTSNKVTSISSSSTNTQYPSALAVYNYINSLNGNGVSY